MYCNRCGHRNPEGSNFCSSCGAPLDVGDPTTTTTITFTPVEAEPDTEDLAVTVTGSDFGAGTLVVKRGPNAGSRFVLGPDVTTVGRHPDSDVFLDDVATLSHGDELQVGKFRLVLFSEQ